MRAKKHLGQNFLNSPTVIDAVVSAAEISSQDTVLEIGPGKGSLTRALLKAGKTVIAVEKDSELIPRLEAQFAPGTEAGKLQLVEGDILDPSMLKKLKIKKGGYKVVANIPYYITGQILRLFLSGAKQPQSITLIVQKEVAERIVARDKKESVLSLSVKAYSAPKYIKKIPARYFSPKPKVDSAIMHIDNISKSNFGSKKEEELFFTLVKTGFSHKRKFLLNNLEELFDKKKIRCVFKQCGLPENTRAEDVPFEKWLCLLKNFK